MQSMAHRCWTSSRHDQRNVKCGVTTQAKGSKGAWHYMWAWQVYGGAWDYPFYGRTYVLALEPFSSPAGSLTDNIERGTCHTLPAGGSMEMNLRAGFFAGAQSPVRGVKSDGAVVR